MGLDISTRSQRLQLKWPLATRCHRFQGSSCRTRGGFRDRLAASESATSSPGALLNSFRARDRAQLPPALPFPVADQLLLLVSLLANLLAAPRAPLAAEMPPLAPAARACSYLPAVVPLKLLPAKPSRSHCFGNQPVCIDPNRQAAMRLALVWALALLSGWPLARAALPAAPNCAEGAAMPGSWHTVGSAADIPMDKLAPALKQRLAEAPYNDFWSCSDANAVVNLEQACTQGTCSKHFVVLPLCPAGVLLCAASPALPWCNRRLAQKADGDTAPRLPALRSGGRAERANSRYAHLQRAQKRRSHPGNRLRAAS